jgi:hypothetical protein
MGMSRYERSQYFEAICRLQAAYLNRSDDDRRSDLSIDDAMAYAEAVMAAFAAEADGEAILDEIEAEAASSSSGDPRD